MARSGKAVESGSDEVWQGLFHIRVYRILSLRPSFGVGRGILNKGVMKCGGRRKSEDMTYPANRIDPDT